MQKSLIIYSKIIKKIIPNAEGLIDGNFEQKKYTNNGELNQYLEQGWTITYLLPFADQDCLQVMVIIENKDK